MLLTECLFVLITRTTRHTRNMIHILNIARLNLTLRFRSQLSFGHVSTQWVSTDLRIEKKIAGKKWDFELFFLWCVWLLQIWKIEWILTSGAETGKNIVGWSNDGLEFIHWFNLSRIRLRLFVHVWFFFRSISASRFPYVCASHTRDTLQYRNWAIYTLYKLVSSNFCFFRPPRANFFVRKKIGMIFFWRFRFRSRHLLSD